jgi:hypothetical protein
VTFREWVIQGALWLRFALDLREEQGSRGLERHSGAKSVKFMDSGAPSGGRSKSIWCVGHGYLRNWLKWICLIVQD